MRNGLASPWRKALYWSLALAAGALLAQEAVAQSSGETRMGKRKPARTDVGAVYNDLVTEWELVNGAAIELRQRIDKAPRDDDLRRQMANLAVRGAAGAERALAAGNANLFNSFRHQFVDQFLDTLPRIRRRIELGSGQALYTAGVVELHGFAGPADVGAACRNFEAALARGYLSAKFRASQCLDKTDPARALVLLREAAAGGHPLAAEIVARACLAGEPQDVQCAWDRLAVAAAAGRPSAQSLLGWMHARGVGGKGPDPARAARFYRQAATAGDAAAQNNFAELYEAGRGVAADLPEAIRWYRKAAESGFAPAQFNLGRLYAAGTGVQKDFAEARRWLEDAERGGIADARRLLDWMEKQLQDPTGTK
jgi:hypothetical protein